MKSTSKIPSIKQLVELTPEQRAIMKTDEIYKVVKKMSSVANNRIKALEKTEMGITSPAYQAYKDRGKPFTAEGKTRNQLQNEYKSLQTFLNYKTSTVTGFKNAQKKVATRLGGEFSNAAQSKKFWKTYRDIAEKFGSGYAGAGGRIHQKFGAKSSEQIQQLLYKVVSNPINNEVINKINISRAKSETEANDLTRLGLYINAKGEHRKVDLRSYKSLSDIMIDYLTVEYEAEQLAEVEAFERFASNKRNLPY